MNDVEHVCQCVMTLPHEFCFSEERRLVYLKTPFCLFFYLFTYFFRQINCLFTFFSSSTSSNSSFEVSDSNEHLLDFVVTTVDQIDFSLYNAFESMTNRVSKLYIM